MSTKEEAALQLTLEAIKVTHGFDVTYGGERPEQTKVNAERQAIHINTLYNSILKNLLQPGE